MMNNSTLPQAAISSLNTYTDFKGLNALKFQASKDQSAALDKVAKQFESLFTSLMLKSMRKANSAFSEGNMLNSNQTKFYQQMFDSQISLSLSQGKGMGIADVLKRQLSKSLSGSAEGESKPVNPLGYKSISDYPRTLPHQMSSSELQKLNETLKAVNATVAKIEHRAVAKIEHVEVKVGTLNSSPNVEKSALPVSEKNAPQFVQPDHFSSPQDYVEKLYPMAQQVEKETGISAHLMLAQSALETGWGKSMIQNADKSNSHNLFGIKADNRWQGNVTNVVTTEYREGIALKEKADFRSYSSFTDSFRDYANFLNSNPRYKEALAQATNPEQFAKALQEAGYATDPNYATKISDILSRDIFSSTVPKGDL